MILEEMIAQREALLTARYRGVRTVEIDGRRVTYATDNEMAAAIMDLERRIALAGNDGRRRRILHKGWPVPKARRVRKVNKVRRGHRDRQDPKGSQGRQGPAGADGTDGATWRSGSGAPSNGLGLDGDFYFRSALHAHIGTSNPIDLHQCRRI